MIEFKHLKETDSEIYNLIMEEYDRQNNCLELIASENEPSESVLEAQASYHTLKYAEGYPGKRYYGGCRIIDKTEQLAIDRACKLFQCNYANVQPHSGASANTAVQFALAKPRDTIMGMSLNSGGHLTHGAKPTFSGKYFKSVQYEVDKDTYEIDYDALEDLIFKNRPKIFIAGASAYSREIDFKKIKDIIDKYNHKTELEIMSDRFLLEEDIPDEIDKKHCYFMVDMAHIAGLVAAGLHQSPIPYADVVTSTTHKTLRGPRGGIILTNNAEIAKKINSAVFPGIQGGPLENIIAAKAVCFGEALKPEFKEYMEKVVENTKVLSMELTHLGCNILTQGTDNHLLLLDLRNTGITGQKLESRLEEISIISNKNAIPFDTEKKTITSGLRLGAAAVTSRGLVIEDMRKIAYLICKCIEVNDEEFNLIKNELILQVQEICKKYPLYKD
jgi:glycine hydroxymethyltransferase